ncbi:pyruvate, water dikinase [Planomonospora sphaerica]|uniref:Pyruvate, water dikinase n=1 Tax=Planomonospora sphaerica TaxID=161355 RepID=A0A171DL18_9ACTN|nr:PEP/pyruvate-binding domain-containing protein [Planomonospora sphaerica]GAT69519.1 pyruvate, water dikinase [Planomonospora sphaerica]
MTSTNCTERAVVGRLTDPGVDDPALSGGKGANLAALARSGLPVPDGFVVSTAAYRRFVHERGIAPIIMQVIDGLGGDPGDIDAASARLRRAFEEGPVPAWLREPLAGAYAALGRGAVAVRSSATAEDLLEASFAGQQESVLNVAGTADLCDAVRRCWSSLWTARALAYRQRHEIGHEYAAMAVVVQRMVSADVAGVLFTADPLSGRRDRMVIEAAAGLGEAVVSGQVTPERWVVDASTRAVLTGPDRPPGPGDVAGRPLLDPGQLDALVGLGARAAALFGCPQDVEWAVAGRSRRLLQSRPITSLFPLPAPPPEDGLRVYMPLLLAGQGITEPLTPAGTAFFRALAAGWLPHWAAGSGRRYEPDASAWLPVVAGRLYGDVTVLLRRPWLAARVLSGLEMKDPATAAVLREWLRRNTDRLPRTHGPLPAPGSAAWLLGMLSRLAAVVVAPARARRRMLTAVERRLAELVRREAELSTPLQRMEFVERTLPSQALDLVAGQLPLVYAELLIRRGAEWLIERWLGSASVLEPVGRWLPHDPTTAMGAELARLARNYGTAGVEPSPTDPGIEAFLAAYGHRAPDREIDLGLPRLADDPAYVIELIRAYLQAGEPGRTSSRFESGAGQATAAAGELVTAVRRIKGPLRALALRGLLDRYRELGGVRERPKFDLVRVIALGRRALLGVGTVLAAQGLLDDADDVFFLDAADVRAALAGASPQLRAVSAANRREYRRELRRRAVPRLLVSDGETVYGPAVPAGGPADLSGTAVSPGVYEGRVRVVDSPVGSGLRPGEILVAASTDPGWTPLFLIAGALVMEVGGVISHGAVVAREYGIPAVAGVGEATTRLRTGQRIRVDGENGLVTVLDR